MSEGRSLDIIEIDAASHTGVDNIRELRETVKLPPSLATHKIYIIDEVHMLSIGAFNALLKTLEEPPAHVVFILATTALHKVPDTIVSRCQRFDLSRFPLQSIVDKLSKIAKAEKLKIDTNALEMIAQTAEGGMRDAESLLMQIASLEGSQITEDSVVEMLGTTKKANIVELLERIGRNDLYACLSFIRNLAQEGADLSIFASVLLHYLRDLLLISANPKIGINELDTLTDEEKKKLLEFASLFSPEKIVEMLENFQVAQVTTKTAVITELPMEIALVKILSESEGNISSSAPTRKEGSGSAPGERSPSAQPHRDDPPVQKMESITIETPKKTETKTATEIKIETTEISKNNSEQSVSEITQPSRRIDLSAVRESWAAILNTAKHLNASLSLALSTARPVETEGATIVIAVKYPFHKERLEEKNNRLTLEKAFDSILGQNFKLSIVLEESTIMKDEPKKEHMENPLVTQAVAMLGGRIVTES